MRCIKRDERHGVNFLLLLLLLLLFLLLLLLLLVVVVVLAPFNVFWRGRGEQE